MPSMALLQFSSGESEEKTSSNLDHLQNRNITILGFATVNMSLKIDLQRSVRSLESSETSVKPFPPSCLCHKPQAIPSVNGFFILPFLQGGTTLLGRPLPAAQGCLGVGPTVHVDERHRNEGWKPKSRIYHVQQDY